MAVLNTVKMELEYLHGKRLTGVDLLHEAEATLLVTNVYYLLQCITPSKLTRQSPAKQSSAFQVAVGINLLVDEYAPHPVNHAPLVC